MIRNRMQRDGVPDGGVADHGSSGHEGTDRTPIVLLGASNLTLGWPQLVRTLAAVITEPLDVYAAHGLGRSYLTDSRCLFRELPGILDCRIWEVLHTAASRHSLARALIADLGNDLAYGRSVTQVVAAVESCVVRFRTLWPDMPIVVSRPPLASLRKLSRARFRFFRTVIFPFSRIQLPDVLQKVESLDARLADMAPEYQLQLFQPSLKSYGLDPIHPRRSSRAEVFRSMLSQWTSGDSRPAPANAPSLRRPAADTRKLFGRLKHTAQPCISTDRLRVFAY